jgi:hypothetical protein
MGSGAGLFFGNVDREVGLVTLPDRAPRLPRLYARPKTIANRLAWLAEPEPGLVRRIPSRLLVHGQAAPADLLGRLIDLLPEGQRYSLETSDRYLLVYRRSPRSARRRVSAELRQLLEALARSLR